MAWYSTAVSHTFSKLERAEESVAVVVFETAHDQCMMSCIFNYAFGNLIHSFKFQMRTVLIQEVQVMLPDTLSPGGRRCLGTRLNCKLVLLRVNGTILSYRLPWIMTPKHHRTSPLEHLYIS